MAAVKRAGVPPTHPTVYVGLALAVVGLLLATFAYTGTRVYDVAYAFVALAGAVLALAGILTAAWGRSILSARASRARRAAFSEDALALRTPEEPPAPAPAKAQGKSRFAFGRSRAPKPAAPAEPGALFAFKRRAPAQPPTAPDDPRNPEVATRLAEEEPAAVSPPIRATLRCPQCQNQFVAEGVRPFEATCTQCGFRSMV